VSVFRRSRRFGETVAYRTLGSRSHLGIKCGDPPISIRIPSAYHVSNKVTRHSYIGADCCCRLLGRDSFQPCIHPACSSDALSVCMATSRFWHGTEWRLAPVLDWVGEPSSFYTLLNIEQYVTPQTLGWAGYVRVDDTTYTFLGDPVVAGAELATQKSLEVLLVSSYMRANLYTLLMQFTSTQSIFVMTAGPVDLNVNFFSPVEVLACAAVCVLFAVKSCYPVSPQTSSSSLSPSHIWHYPRCLMMAVRIPSAYTLI
jgi:hypothetical protein